LQRNLGWGSSFTLTWSQGKWDNCEHHSLSFTIPVDIFFNLKMNLHMMSIVLTCNLVIHVAFDSWKLDFVHTIFPKTP
jgi:hypothetical protein